MNLGERIYRLRTQRNLSQSDLAEALGVSRQSVSKWENNNAVPELEKLIKMAELFEISLDELVANGTSKGTKGPCLVTEGASAVTEKRLSKRQIMGTVFCCAGAFVLLYYALEHEAQLGLRLALPLGLCGVWWFTKLRHPGLWSVWTVCLPLVFTPLRFYFRIDIGWALTLALYVPLFLGTVWCLRKEPVKWTKKMAVFLAVGYVICFAVFLGEILGAFRIPFVELNESYDRYQSLRHGVEACVFLLFTTVASLTQRILRQG